MAALRAKVAEAEGAAEAERRRAQRRQRDLEAEQQRARAEAEEARRKQAAAMFRDTAKWRAETIDGVLAEFGQFVDAAEGDADADAWTWRAAPSTRRATLGLAHGFASVLDAPAPECELQPAGAAVAVWRISAADWNGIAREELDEAGPEAGRGRDQICGFGQPAGA